MNTLTDLLVDDIAVTRHIKERLTAVYTNRYAAAQVEAAVERAHAQLASATVKVFVPILTERLARQILDGTDVTPARNGGRRE